MAGRKLWVILIGLWFLLWGLVSLFHLSFEGIGLVLGLLAIIGGICLFLDR